MVAPSVPSPVSPEAERRRHPRYNMALDVVFGPVPATGTPPPAEALQRSVTVNLSHGGLCLYSDSRFPVGTQLWCAVSLPQRPQPLELLGTVAWFQKLDQESHGFRIGLEFARINAEARAALNALLEHPPAASAPRAKRLLLVDDDQELQLALKLRFESLGFEVITASEGLEGLRKGREERPHLILLDLMLPKLNGYEVCRLLKFDQKFRHIPIVLMTARSRQDDIRIGQEVGADAYVTKPFDGQGLIAKVEALLAGTSP